MDDMTAFERQVAGEFVRRAGPERPVNAAAIFTAITATKSPKWRFQPMFSATKFVVAGAIVALFGSFLFSGVLTQQASDDRLRVVGASASATAQAEPTDAATSESEPTTEAEADDTATATDLLPGVDLELREVGRGIYEVLGDGHHDLRQNVWDIAITSDGEAWVEKHRVVYRPKQYRDDRLRSSYRDVRVLRLGEPGVMRRASADVDDVRLYVNLDSQGDVLVSGTRTLGKVWRDGVWQEPDLRCSHAFLNGSVCWVPNYDGAGIRRLDYADGSERLITPVDLGLDPDAGFGRTFASGSDGTVWTDTYGVGIREAEPEGRFTGLAFYDGERWATVGADSAVPTPAGPDRLAVAPDGDVWMVARNATDESVLTVARWDGTTWETFGPVEGLGWHRDIHFAPDGKIWFDAITHYDGDALRQVEIPTAVTSGELRGGPYAFGPDGSIWVVLIDMRDPKSLGCEVDPGVCEGVPGLYVITPEAVAAG